MTDPAFELARQLIARPSITPSDEGCQKLVADRLSEWGFNPEFMRFGDVDNLWLRRGSGSPLVVFAGHTDVVPTGPLDQWGSDPFSPALRDGKLYGRGAADMKSSIAAFTTAAARFVRDHPNHGGSIALLLTSDEEGPAVDGTVRVVRALQDRQDLIDYCIVGEPTSEKRLGDTIKIGRRGSLSGRLVVRGVQGHVAYPHLAANPIHLCAPALSILVATGWDAGNEQFPPTTFQITRIGTGNNADNVIPGEVSINFNFRHSTESTAAMLINRVEKVLDEHQLSFELEWTISGSPFITTGGELIDTVRQAIRDELGVDTRLSTSGGTSDGRFIAPTGAQVVELGPINDSIHKIDEHIALDAPRQLSNVYERILVSLLSRT